MKIDAHHHLWDLNAVNYPWIMDETPRFFGDHATIRRDYLLPEFRNDAKKFDASVHIQVGAADPMAEAKWIQSVADKTPDWPMVQVVFCDLTQSNLKDAFKAYQAMSTLRGVRQIVGRSPEEDAATGTNDLLDDPSFLDGLKRAADHGLSFDLQLIPELMPKMAELISKVPDLQVALCHAGSPYDRSNSGLNKWAKLLMNLSELSNVKCKLSGLGMFDHNWTPGKIRPIVDTVFQQFGVDRVMFGSNFPVDSLSSSYGELFDAYDGLVADKDRFFGTVAKKFYKF